MADNRKTTVWEVLEKYADIRDELDDAIESLASSVEDMQYALMDLEDQAAEISLHLAQCDKVFHRFKSRNPRYFDR
ncbi:MAG: hypothetical protein IJH90_02705 [Mogibacterium sp.]|nr:hypothetical protein [Mogibacterium sp.]